MTDKAVLGDLPEGVESAMFLRDGWPHAVVCKVLMKTGCVGIGLARMRPWHKVSPAEADRAALSAAMANISDTPPDYTDVVEHVARMQAAAQARANGE